jgi:hypothetical protein
VGDFDPATGGGFSSGHPGLKCNSRGGAESRDLKKSHESFAESYKSNIFVIPEQTSNQYY